MDSKYKDILRHFASCGLYKYENIGIPYRREYIDPALKTLNKSIEQFNIDLQEENRKVMEELNSLAHLSEDRYKESVDEELKQELSDELNKYVGNMVEAVNTKLGMK